MKCIQIDLFTMQLFEVIERLKVKIGVVIADNKRLTTLLEKSELRNRELREQNKLLVEQVSKLEQTVANNAAAEKFANVSGGTNLAVERIDDLLNEVEQCIALMNK